MPDKPFVINDRRKFTAEGELRPDASPSEPKSSPAPVHSEAHTVTPQPEPGPGPQLVSDTQPEAAEPDLPAENGSLPDDNLPPPPTAEQSEQAARAYDATVDRLDTAIRATNPGMDRVPEMSFERVVQSIYMQAMLQLGGATEPGQQPQVDLLGARQTIDMLSVIVAKSAGNLSTSESTLADSALFELRMGFLEITQALARQSAARQPNPAGGPGSPFGGPGGPSIVR